MTVATGWSWATTIEVGTKRRLRPAVVGGEVGVGGSTVGTVKIRGRVSVDDWYPRRRVVKSSRGSRGWSVGSSSSSTSVSSPCWRLSGSTRHTLGTEGSLGYTPYTLPFHPTPLPSPPFSPSDPPSSRRVPDLL